MKLKRKVEEKVKGKKPVSRLSLAQREQWQKPWASSRRARRAHVGSTRLTTDL